MWDFLTALRKSGLSNRLHKFNGHWLGHPKRSTGDGPSFSRKLVPRSDPNVLQLLTLTGQDSKSVGRSVHHAGRSLRICKCVCQEAGRRGWRCVRVLSCNLGGCTRLICISIQRRPSKWHKCPAAWTNVQLFVGIPTAWMTTHMFGILAADQYLIPEPTYVNGLQALWPAMRVISEAIPTGCQSSHLNSSSGDCPEPVRNRRPSSSTSWAIRSSKPGIFDCSKFSHARLIYARTLQKDTAMRLRCDCDCCCYSYCFCGVSSQRTTGLTGPAGSESEAVSSVTTIHCENFH